MPSYTVEMPGRAPGGERGAAAVGRIVIRDDGTGLLVLRHPFKLELRIVPAEDEPTRPGARTPSQQ